MTCLGNRPMAKTILVVDDDDDTRGLICTILRSGGYVVLDATNCEMAREIHRRHRGEIDLLLTDLSLPGRNGCELAAVLRKSEPQLPVLFMSGMSEPEVSDVIGTLDKGAPYLQKPFGVAELLRHVQHV
jgi:two-component system, cell cycle sensor histidine kinase and response regulator CckA